MIFEDGSREPLHGHNYHVKIKGSAKNLKGDVVFDFLHIKPIVREICDSLDHKLILPALNKDIEILENGANTEIKTKDSFFSIPTTDVLNVAIDNTSVECIAVHISEKVRELVKERFQYQFETLELEVEETQGQSAVYIYKEEK